MIYSVYVIIVTYNGISWIDKCLDSLKLSTIGVKTVVVDNQSTDGTVEFIKHNFPDTYIIQNNYNAGFGLANNIGIKYAIDQDANFILLLNQDAWVESDVISKMLEVALNNKTYGIVAPIQLNGEGDELDKNFTKYIDVDTIRGLSKINDIQIVDFVNAACWLMPVSTIQKVGGFDPLFMHYGEDRDYCQRVKYHTMKVAVVNNSYIYHDRSYSSKNHFRKTDNILFTIGLSKLKNINNSYVNQLIRLLIERFKKTVKALIKGEFMRAYLEQKNIFKLLFMSKQIIKSRNLSKNNHLVYL